MTGLPAPWPEHATLTARARRSAERKQRLTLTEVTPRWDVDSVTIDAPLPDGLQRVELACGRVAVWTLTADELRELPVAEGRVELLRHFMSHLPVSKLFWQELHLTATFDREELPAFGVHLRRCFPPEVSVAMRGQGARGALLRVKSGMGSVDGEQVCGRAGP